jgi:hypothetical protein
MSYVYIRIAFKHSCLYSYHRPYTNRRSMGIDIDTALAVRRECAVLLLLNYYAHAQYNFRFSDRLLRFKNYCMLRIHVQIILLSIYIKMEPKMYNISSIENGWADLAQFFFLIVRIKRRFLRKKKLLNKCYCLINHSLI